MNVVVYAMTGVQQNDRALTAVATVIYPAPQELRVGVRMAKTTFRPGENASANLHVKPAGRKGHGKRPRSAGV